MIDGHRTSISLETPFWEALKDVAKRKQMPVNRLVEVIDDQRGDVGLSGAVRIYLLNFYREAAKGAMS